MDWYTSYKIVEAEIYRNKEDVGLSSFCRKVLLEIKIIADEQLRELPPIAVEALRWRILGHPRIKKDDELASLFLEDDVLQFSKLYLERYVREIHSGYNAYTFAEAIHNFLLQSFKIDYHILSIYVTLNGRKGYGIKPDTEVDPNMRDFWGRGDVKGAAEYYRSKHSAGTKWKRDFVPNRQDSPFTEPIWFGKQ